MSKAAGVLGVLLILLGIVAVGLGALTTLFAAMLFLFAASARGVEHTLDQLPVFTRFVVWCVLLPLALGLVMMPAGVRLRRQWEQPVSRQLTVAITFSLVILGYLLFAPLIRPLAMEVIQVVGGR